MGLSDKLKTFGDRAKESAAENRESISSAVEAAGVLADKRTRGRYSDKIAKAASMTEAAVERFAGTARAQADDQATGDAGAAPAPATPRADHRGDAR